jgi:hypothetical protein
VEIEALKVEALDFASAGPSIVKSINSGIC